MSKDEKLVDAYIESVGREPRNLPADHPDRWMWDYVGRSEEDRAHLAELFQAGVRVQDETLF